MSQPVLLFNPNKKLKTRRPENSRMCVYTTKAYTAPTLKVGDEAHASFAAGCNMWPKLHLLDVVDQIIDSRHAGLHEAAIQLHDGVSFLDAGPLANSALKHLRDDHPSGELALCDAYRCHLPHQLPSITALATPAWMLQGKQGYKESYELLCS